jgi:hypothetical protein
MTVAISHDIIIGGKDGEMFIVVLAAQQRPRQSMDSSVSIDLWISSISSKDQ